MSQPVYTLLCHRDMQMALVTFPGILSFLQPGQQFIVMDDGSLTAEDSTILTALSPQIRIITRAEREDYVQQAIRKHPECKKFRDEYGPAFKLIDIPLLALQEQPRFIYTDSDIIYLRKSQPYFSRTENTYLMTDAIKLSFKLQNAFFKYRWTVPYRFNSGYFSFDAKDFDLDFVEYFVSRPDVRNIPWVIEQTGWALLFGRAGASLTPSENQFICRENFEGPTDETLAIHLIAKLKGKVQEWSVLPPNAPDRSEAPLFEPSRNVTLFDWAQKSARRIFSFS